jgi:hypothetical protein
MEPIIIAALIAAVGAIVAPIVNAVVTKVISRRPFKLVARDRKTAIAGKWTGEALQDREGGDPVVFDISMELTATKKLIRGQMHISGELDGEQFVIIFDAEGGFIHDDFLQLSYVSTDKKALHFGAITCRLDDLGTAMTARFSGYGAFSHGLISGTAGMSKSV